LDRNCDTNSSASGPETKDFVDPNSLTVMEHSLSWPIDDQWEASTNLGDPGPELGIYEDIGVPMEPKIHKLKIAQQFIESLKNATLNNSTLNDWVCERLCNPPTITVDDMLDPILRLSIDIYLAVGNGSQETYNSVCNALMHYNPAKPLLSYDIVKWCITEISRVTAIQEDMCVNTCIAFTGLFSKLEICPECAELCYDPQKS